MSTLSIQQAAISLQPAAGHECRGPENSSYPILEGWIDLVGGWIARHRQRRALRELAIHAPHLLTDIGVTEAQALREAAKPFWR